MKKENAQIRLKRIMDERGLRQVDILRMSEPWQKKLDIKISKNTLSQYINGISSPDNYKATLLAKTLGVNEAWLLGYDVPRNDEESSTQFRMESPIIEETVEVMKKLKEPRQQIVLDTATSQLKEQKDEESNKKKKIVSIFDKNSPLTDEELQEAVDQAVAFDGKPLTDREKEVYKHLLFEAWEEDHGRG